MRKFLDVEDRHEATLISLEEAEWGTVEESKRYNPVSLVSELLKDKSKALQGNYYSSRFCYE